MERQQEPEDILVGVKPVQEGKKPENLRVHDMLYPVKTAFIMINFQSNYETEVAEQLGAIKAVKEVVRTNGIHDIVTTIESSTIGELKESIRRIQKIPYIKSTITLIKYDSRMLPLAEISMLP